MILLANKERLLAFTFQEPCLHVVFYDRNSLNNKEQQKADKLAICEQIVRMNQPATVKVIYYGGDKSQEGFEVKLTIKGAKWFIEHHG